MSSASKYLLLGTLITFLAPEALGNTRSFHTMTTGNGHHFSLFDRNTGRITEFLEHPYAFVAPADDGGTYGIHRRNLAHDLYFGVQAPSANVWLTNLDNVEYLEQTQIIRGQQNVGALETKTHYFAPFDLDAKFWMLKKHMNHSFPCLESDWCVVRSSVSYGWKDLSQTNLLNTLIMTV